MAGYCRPWFEFEVLTGLHVMAVHAQLLGHWQEMANSVDKELIVIVIARSSWSIDKKGELTPGRAR